MGRDGTLLSQRAGFLLLMCYIVCGRVTRNSRAAAMIFYGPYVYG